MVQEMTPGRTAAVVLFEIAQLAKAGFYEMPVGIESNEAKAMKILTDFRNAALTEAAGMVREKYFIGLGLPEPAEEWLAKQIEALREP